MATYREIEEHILHRRAFRSGPIRAEVQPSADSLVQGQLGGLEFSRLIAEAMDGSVSYLVYHDGTPVAWVLPRPRGMHVTDQFVSRPAVRIQKLCRSLA
jgi:hypothetical protein